MNGTVTVSQLNQYLKYSIDRDEALQQIAVQGEVSNFTNHRKTGHFYFTLKDEACSIKAVMFRTYASRVRFEVENGMKVIVTGSVRLFERDGAVQLYCEELQPDGVGALYLAFEQLKERLGRQGLFAPEHKKRLPAFPKKIGVVTSKTGAAIQDILNILSRRYPLGTVVLIPALVQGENAPQSICEGISLAQAAGDIDLLIVGRGGGSIEDLWCFNDERVARAIYDCSIPVISAVGHEIDFTIADFVADLRAPTPSAAAELAVPDSRELLSRVAGLSAVLDTRLSTLLSRQTESLHAMKKRLAAHSPEQRMKDGRETLLKLSARLEQGIAGLQKMKTEQYLRQVATLEALSPLKVLTRGYSITMKGGAALTDIDGLHEGDELETRLHRGKITSIVTHLEDDREENRKDG